MRCGFVIARCGQATVPTADRSSDRTFAAAGLQPVKFEIGGEAPPRLELVVG